MQPEIQAAAQWWADQLRRPASFDAVDSTTKANISDLLSLIEDEPLAEPLSEDKITAFQQALEQVLLLKLVWPDNFVINVEYYPDLLLESAAKLALVNISYKLPLKTIMWIRPRLGLIEVACGYGAEFKTIFERK